MRLTRILGGIFGMLFFITSLNAQDIHFSQFYLSPLTLNPALTGVSNCDVRFTANYRSQWGSVLQQDAYNTIQVSYDQRFPSGKRDNFGFGVSLLSDRAGESSLSSVGGKLSGSYQRYMGGDRNVSHFLSAGAEFGVVQRSIDFLALRFGNQVDFNQPDNFDANLPNNELFDQDNFFYIDAGAGLTWYSVWSDTGSSFYAGIAATHLNRPDFVFVDSNSDSEAATIFTRITAHIGAELQLNNKIGIVPNFVLFRQGPSQEINAGSSIKFLIERSKWAYKTFQVGAYARVSNHFVDATTFDAIIIHTRFDFNQFTAGFSYDANVSPLRPASNTAGAFEFSLGYKICEGRQRAQGCPDNF